MKRALVAVGLLGSLTACGTASTAPTAATSSAPPPAIKSATATRTAPSTSPSPSAFTTATPGCKTFDVDYATKMEDGTWTGGVFSWCAVPGKSLTQADMAQQTVDSERQAGVFVECDLIAPDADNPQFMAWANDLNDNGRPVLHHIIAEVGNC